MSRETRFDAITNRMLLFPRYIIISRAKNDFRNRVDYDTNADFRRSNARGEKEIIMKVQRASERARARRGRFIKSLCEVRDFQAGETFSVTSSRASSRELARVSFHVGAASRCRISQADTIDFTRSRDLLPISFSSRHLLHNRITLYALFFSARLNTMNGEKRHFRDF